MLAAGPPSGFTTTSQLLGGGGSPVESLQSHFILTMSHWSSGLPICFPSQGTRVQIPKGVLSETEILLLAMSRYTALILVQRKGDKGLQNPHNLDYSWDVMG
jgi:hypothetical protein